MKVENKNGRPDLSAIPEKHRENISYSYIREEDKYEVKLPPGAEIEILRSEFDQKLEERVNQIADAVASGAQGQELADEMRKK